MAFSLEQLDERLAERAKASPDESYTAKLLRDGVDRCARKFGEEAIETIVAAVARDKTGVANEAADVFYHLLVMLHARGITLAEVEELLETRTKKSGLEEKASRPRE